MGDKKSEKKKKKKKEKESGDDDRWKPPLPEKECGCAVAALPSVVKFPPLRLVSIFPTSGSKISAPPIYLLPSLCRRKRQYLCSGRAFLARFPTINRYHDGHTVVLPFYERNFYAER